MTPGRSTSSRHRCTVPAAAAVAVALLGACSASGPTSVDVGSDSRVVFFGPASQGATVISSSAVAAIRQAGSSPTTVGANPTPDRQGGGARGGSIDLDGAPWWVMADGVPLTPGSTPHAAASAIRALEAPPGESSAGSSTGSNVRVDPWGVAVVDAQTVLAATNTAPGTTAWHAADSMVHAVSATGSRVVAGKPGDGTDHPVSSLKQGESAPADAVSLELVQAVVPLGQDSFVLLMNAPTQATDRDVARLSAAWVSSGTIRPVRTPDLCAAQYAVRGVRVDGHRLVVSAPPFQNGECSPSTNAWVELDVSSGQATTLGSGRGLAYLDGDRLVTATRDAADSSTVSVAWQDRQGG